MKFNVISNFRETSCFFLQFFVMLLVLLCLCHDCDSSSATATTTTTTTILQPVYRTTCISCRPPPQLSNGGFCLSKVFSAHVPLLMAVSEFWLRRICWGSLQLHYVHCSTLFVIVSAFIFVFLWWLWIRLSDLPMYVYVTVHCSGRLMMVLFCLSTGIQ